MLRKPSAGNQTACNITACNLNTEPTSHNTKPPTQPAATTLPFVGNCRIEPFAANS